MIAAMTGKAVLMIVISPLPSAIERSVASPRLAAQLSALEISRSPEACCDAPVPAEACERLLAASSPFLPALAVSLPSFPLSPSARARPGARVFRNLMGRASGKPPRTALAVVTQGRLELACVFGSGAAIENR